jgi:hypothetical protein
MFAGLIDTQPDTYEHRGGWREANFSIAPAPDCTLGLIEGTRMALAFRSVIEGRVWGLHKRRQPFTYVVQQGMRHS